ncbi:MAG: PAS domain-containing protein [Rhodospirillales bacterium]|nr:PAS domain-containing protein [Rhodospirillales bacterium]
MSGKRYLFWRAATIGLAILAGAYGAALHLRDLALTRAEINLRNLGHAIAGQTEATMAGIEFALKGVRERIEANPLQTPESLTTILTSERANVPFLRSMTLIGADGIMRFLANLPMPSPPSDFNDRAWFMDVRDNPGRHFRIGEPVKSRVTGLWLVPLILRLDDRRGQFAGTLVGALDPAFFEKKFMDFNLGPGAAIALQRKDSMLLARQPFDETTIGQVFPKGPIYQAVKDGADGFVRATSAIDGQKRLISGTHVGTYPLYVAISVTEDAALAGWRVQGAIVGLAAFLLLLLVAVLTRSSLHLQAEAEARQETVRRLDETVRELSESERVLQQAQDVADLGYYVYDVETDRWTSSPILDRIFGIDADYPRDAQGWIDLVAPENRPAMRDYLTHLLATKAGFDREYEIVRKADGARRWVHGLGRLEGGAPGQPLRLLGTVRDITLAREREDEIRRSNAELEQFAYIASHDLREPLRTISSFVALLERRYADRLDAEGRDFIRFAKDGAERLDHLVLDLLDYSRIGRSAQPLAPVALAEIVAAARQNLAEPLIQAGVQLIVADDLPILRARKDEMVRLFQNLIDNAIKYRAADRPCRIEIRARREANVWRIEVADTGIGIKTEYFGRIFRIFQRLHPIDAYGGGSGIGLAICDKIVKSHGGRIGVESDGANGTTFFFTLPAAD